MGELRRAELAILRGRCLKTMALHLCRTSTKIFLVLINIIYVFVGFILAGVGITFLVEKDEFQVLTGDENLVVGISFIIGGCFTVLIAFLGIISSIGEINSLLIVYGALSIVLIGTEVAGGSICYEDKTSIVKNAEMKFEEYMGKYRYDAVSSDDYNYKVNEVIDIAQNGLRCCGLRSYQDWIQYNSDYILQHGYPASCECNKETDGNNCISIIVNGNDIWSNGCNDTFYGLIRSNYIAIGGTGLGIAAIQIIMVVSAFGLALCVLSAKSTERRRARMEALSYTQMEPYGSDISEDDDDDDDDPLPDGAYETRTVNKEIEPNDDVPINDRRMYIQ